jgi:hypothetical protein
MTEWTTRQKAAARYGAALAAFLVAIGAITYVATPTPPTPPTPSTTTTVAPTTTTVPSASADTACDRGPAVTADSTGTRSDRVLASTIASADHCEQQTRVLFEHGSARGTLADDMGFETGWKLYGDQPDPANDYSIPSCRADTTIRVYLRPGWPGSFDVARGTPIPWSKDCRIAGGKDGNVAVLAAAADGTVAEWDLWGVSVPGVETADRPQFGCQADVNNHVTKNLLIPNGLNPGVPAFDPGRDMCAAGVVPVTGPDGRLADMNTYRGNSPDSNGGGTPLTRGEPGIGQVDAGRIVQTMKLFTANTAAGPRCAPDALAVIPLAACATAVAPAGQFEGQGSRVSTAAHAVQTMEGTRLVLVMSDTDRDRIVAAKNLPPVAARCLTIVIDGLRDYGAELLGSSPVTGGADIKVDGADPAAWNSRCLAGVNSDRFLTGVFQLRFMRIVAPPTNHCLVGLTHFACHAADITYP